MFNATIKATISAVENNVAGIGEAQADVARSYAVSQATISRLSPGPFVAGAGASAAVA